MLPRERARMCLRCRKSFKSKWAGNRFCNDCKRLNEENNEEFRVGVIIDEDYERLSSSFRF
jgi:hypothetical protein